MVALVVIGTIIYVLGAIFFFVFLSSNAYESKEEYATKPRKHRLKNFRASGGLLFLIATIWPISILFVFTFEAIARAINRGKMRNDSK